MTTRADTDVFRLLTGEESDGPCRDIPGGACHEEPGNFTRHVNCAVCTALSNTVIGMLLLAGGEFGLLADAAGEETVIAVLALASLAAVPAALRLEEVQAP